MSQTLKTLSLLLLAGAAWAGDSIKSAQAQLVQRLAARNIGLANVGGRIVDLAVVESNPDTFYVAVATGGVWKTSDGGDTWTPIFDQQNTLCIGTVAVSQSKPDIVWVGTGEANILRSLSHGRGVFKSTDGGKTFACMGLTDSRHIGRIVIHPTNPDIVYVAALGHAWGPNKERGLYKTTDGGKTWTNSKYLNENTGFIDVAMDPSDANILYAAAYHFRRDAFSGTSPRVQWGPGCGIYKTIDAGETWTQMTEGLPKESVGRCGLSIYRKDPRVVYAVVQTANKDTSGTYRSDDKGDSWTRVNALCPAPYFFFGQIRVDPSDDQNVYVLGIPLSISRDGGKIFPPNLTPKGIHADQHALWINPKDGKHLILGNDGGLYISKDRGKTWVHNRGLPIGQFYAVGVDMRRPYHVYGGMQDNGSWGGPSATFSPEGITLAEWKRVLGSDGFYCQVDPNDYNTVYCEIQYGGLQRVNLKGGSKLIKPGGKKNPDYRFNWNSPLALSRHDAKAMYFGGQFLFKSTSRGDKWSIVSPDLSRGGNKEDTGHTITTIAESPLKAGLLYAGTDDGRLHVTRNDGTKWTELTDKLPAAVDKERWITRVECAHHAEGTVYVSIDRHRNDDLRPYIFKSTDYGETWMSVVGDLPKEGNIHVVRESSKNKDVLFAGTEFGLYATLDGGKHWHHIKNGIPPGVLVHDLVIHSRERDLVIGTHGRSVYVMDIAPLEELTPESLAKDVYLCNIKPTLVFRPRPPEKAAPTDGFRAANPDFGAHIYYHLKSADKKPTVLEITTADGEKVVSLNGSGEPGLQRVVWNLRNVDNALVKPGDYTVILRVGKQTLEKKVRLEAP